MVVQQKYNFFLEQNSINGIIPLDLLNLTIGSYKVHCEIILLNWGELSFLQFQNPENYEKGIRDWDSR